jgi:sugar phosphate isomerase/epimerase
VSGAGGPAIHPRVCGNGLALGQAPLAEQMRFAAEAGFPAWGLPAERLVEALVAGRGEARVGDSNEGASSALGDGGDSLADSSSGVRVAEREGDVRIAHLLLPSLFVLANRRRRNSESARARAAIDAAATAGARRLVFTTGPAGALSYENAAAALGEALPPVREHAAARGVALLLEPTNQLRDDLGFVHTLRDAVDLAGELGIGVCADLLWCWRERDLEATLRRGSDLIGLVQVSDCETGSTSMPCRVVPGDGAIPLDRVLAAVLESGYGGPFDLELLGPRIDAEGGPGALRRGADRLSELLARLGA